MAIESLPDGEEKSAALNAIEKQEEADKTIRAWARTKESVVHASKRRVEAEKAHMKALNMARNSDKQEVALKESEAMAAAAELAMSTAEVVAAEAESEASQALTLTLTLTLIGG